MQIASQRAARASRTRWARVFFVLALVVAGAGVEKWRSTKPDLKASAANVVTALSGSNHPHYIESQPAWAYGGLAVGAVLVVIGLLLLATRPSVPERAWTDARA